MNAGWYVSVDGKVAGPATDDQLRQLVAQGRLRPTDYVRKGNSAWVVATQVEGLFAAMPARAAPAAAPVAQVAPLAAAAPMAAPVARAAAPAARPAMMAQPAAPAPRPPAGATHASPYPGRRKRSDPTTTVVAIVGGAMLLLAFAGVIVFYLSGRGEAPVADVGVKREKKSEPAPAPPTPAVVVPERTAAERIALVKTWKEFNNKEKGLQKVLSVKFADGWLAAAPTRVKSGPPSPDARFVHLAVQIENQSETETLTYQGWNAPGEDASAHAAAAQDGQGRFATALAPSEAAAIAPVRGKKLPPGETVFDIVALKLPAGDFASLKVALPYAAFQLAQAPAAELTKERAGFRLGVARRLASSAIGVEMTREQLLAGPSTGAIAGVPDDGPDGPGISAIERGIAELEGDGKDKKSRAPPPIRIDEAPPAATEKTEGKGKAGDGLSEANPFPEVGSVSGDRAPRERNPDDPPTVDELNDQFKDLDP